MGEGGLQGPERVDTMGYIEEFLEFLSIPSVGTMPEFKQDTLRAAEWLRKRMAQAGIQDTRVLSTKGQPTVYGKVEAKTPGAPTVLIYGHYDVQPPDPLDQWLSPPFKPEIRDGKIFARGAADNKGGVFAAVAAVEGMVRGGGSPVNLKFFFEGEEESGSPNAPALIAENKELFAADLAVSVDGGGLGPKTPVATTGSKGICGLEIEVTGPASDMHSGQGGGVVNNPLNALAAIVASMKHPDGKIAVQGFYDDVIPLTQAEREAFAKAPINDETLKKATGVPELFGESGYTAVERMFGRPTLDLNGMWGGFQGTGTKTVIPSKAFCKITCRLVADQDPRKIVDLIEEHIKKHTPRGVTAKVTRGGMGVKAYLIPHTHPAIGALIKTQKEIYGTDPAVIRLGGTLPVSRMFLDTLGCYLIFFGASSADENVHAPNEFFRVEEFETLRTGLPVLLGELAKVLK
jgi:acetylornithine deacetylase/succinyl-diaminopimelate desuccinylase-like protein